MVGAAIGGAIGGIGAWMTGASGEEIALAALKGAAVGALAGATGGVAGLAINAAGKAVLGSGVVASAVSAGAGIAGSAVASDVASKFAGHVMDKGFGSIGEFEYSGKEAATAAATGLATFGLGKAFGFVNSSRTAAGFGQRVTQHFAGATAGTASSVLADAVGQGTEYLMSDDKENWKWNWERTKGAAWTGALTGSLAPFFKTCFAAGTPLLTPTGHKNIEDFRAGDLLLSRDENDPDGPVEAKAVEEVFVRNGRILHLHVGGQIIKTTAEHPFYVLSKGWTEASLLQSGDLLASHDGSCTAVEEVYDTGTFETVYNLRVVDLHTYFVGSRAWGFSVWAHNARYEPSVYDDKGKIASFKASKTLDLTGQSVGFTKNTFNKKTGFTYILRDQSTGEILKVGKTTGGTNIYERFNKYRRKSQEYGYKVEAEYWEAGKNADAKALERQIRSTLKSEGHRLPWDKSANPGRGDLGLPWERKGGTTYTIE